MNGNSCREKILSEDYFDFISPIYRELEQSEIGEADICTQEMDFGFRAVYANRAGMAPLSLQSYRYNSIPNCF